MSWIMPPTPAGSVWMDHSAQRYGGIVENSNCIAVCSAACNSGRLLIPCSTNSAIVFTEMLPFDGAVRTLTRTPALSTLVMVTRVEATTAMFSQQGFDT